MIGSTSGMDEVRKLIEGGVELEKLKYEIVLEETLAAACSTS